MNYAGSSSIESVVITNNTGDHLDITDLVLEINVYEDMFTNFMSGNLVIADAVGLLSTLPIIGQEKVAFSIMSSIWGSQSYTFAVYSVTHRNIENATTTSYNLNFVSKEAIDDKLVRISKSYKGTIGQIVKNIFNDWIPSTKNFSVENTNNNTSVIVPYWSPFESMNWLSSRAIPNSAQRASFFLYETKDGFQFNSLDTLFQKESLGLLEYRDSNIASAIGANKTALAGLTIEDYEVLEINDTLKALTNGLLGTSLYYKDLTKNQWNKSNWNYLTEFNKSKHLNNNPIVPNTNGFNTSFIGQTTEARLAYGHDKIFSNVTDSFFPKEWVGSRISTLQQLNNTRLNISVPGHIVFSVGKTVDLSFPKNAPVSKDNKNKDGQLSGRYLISTVRHNFQLKFHRVSMELLKESTL